MSERKHIIEIEIEAPADQVWKAITDGEGITRWFAPEARVEPGVGGSVFLSWGAGMEGTAPITIWEPERRFGWTEQAGTDHQKVVEIVIEGSGGRTKLRLVNSGFGADASFDAEYDSTHGGWHTFLAMLRYGLERRSGVSARNVTALRMGELPQGELWRRVQDAMRITNSVEGSGYRAQLGDIEIGGTVVRHPQPGYLCLTVDEWDGSLLSVFAEHCGTGSVLTLTAVLYGGQTDREPQVRAAINQLLLIAG